MTVAPHAPSARRDQLLERAYAYVLEHGLVGMSLRPLAEAVGSSPRVLLFLFGSKDGLVRELLTRARQDELALLEDMRSGRASDGMVEGAMQVWGWLSEPAREDLLRLWVEGYARSLMDSEGPWGGFAERSVDDWLAVLSELQPPRSRRSAAAVAQRTVVLAVLRGALLDLLATGDRVRTTAAVRAQLRGLA